MADDPAALLALIHFVERLNDLALREGLLNVKWHTLGLKLSVRVSPPPAPWYDVVLPEPEGLEVEADRIEGIGVAAWLNEPGRRTRRPQFRNVNAAVSITDADGRELPINGATFDYMVGDEWRAIQDSSARQEEERRRAAVEYLRKALGPLNDHIVTIRRAEASRITIPAPQLITPPPVAPMAFTPESNTWWASVNLLRDSGSLVGRLVLDSWSDDEPSAGGEGFGPATSRREP